MISNSVSTSAKVVSLYASSNPELAEFARVLFFLLISHADDYGRLPGDVPTTKLRIDPISQRTEREFALSLSILHEVGLITWYTVDNRDIIEIVQFSEHQDLKGHDKRRPPKLPPCPGVHAFIGCERRKSERQAVKSPLDATSGGVWGDLGESGGIGGSSGENGDRKKERKEPKEGKEEERELDRARKSADSEGNTKPSGPLCEPAGDARPSAALGAGASSNTKPSGQFCEPAGDARPSAALGAGAQPREAPPKPFRFDLAFVQLRDDYPPERVQDSVLIRQEFIKAFDGLENGSREDLFAKMRTSLAGHKRSEQWQDRRRVPMFGKWISERRWIQTLPTAWLAESPPPRGTGRTAVVPGKYARVAKRDDPP